jgi:hypothetical protein
VTSSRQAQDKREEIFESKREEIFESKRELSCAGPGAWLQQLMHWGDGRWGQVRKRISFAPFDTKNDRFTKTGSGRTVHRESTHKREMRFPTATTLQAPPTSAPVTGSVRKTVFKKPFIYKCDLLPRQARDKHRENSF